MKRVTLEEAARQLGISKGSAYKRVQRGTLAHKKGLDGRLYIYLDSEKGGDKDANAKDANGEKSRVAGERNLLSLTTLANASAIFAALGLAIYVLGLVSLLMPISRTFTHDLSAAWYAVAVLPKTVAAGQGVLLLAKFVLYYLLGIVLSAFLLLEITSILKLFRSRFFGRTPILPKRGQQLLEKLDKRYQVKKYARPLLMICVMLATFAYLLWLTVFALEKPPDQSIIERLTSSQVLFLAGMSFYLLTCYLGVELMMAALERRSGNFLPSLRKRNLFFWGTGIIIACSFVLASLTATFTEPGLPTAEIDGSNDVNGALLAHTDGFWYVFKYEGENKGHLIAIPDDEVDKVRVHEGNQ